MKGPSAVLPTSLAHSNYPSLTHSSLDPSVPPSLSLSTLEPKIESQQDSSTPGVIGHWN